MNDDAKKKADANAKALAMIDAMYAKRSDGHPIAGPAPANGIVLHWWGQFSGELAGDFHLDGGHGYLEASSLAEAERLAQALRKHVLTTWPGTKEWADVGWYRWMRPDTKQMTLQFMGSAPPGIHARKPSS